MGMVQSAGARECKRLTMIVGSSLGSWRKNRELLGIRTDTHDVTPVSTMFWATRLNPAVYASSSSSYTEKSKLYAPLIWMSMSPGLGRVRADHLETHDSRLT